MNFYQFEPILIFFIFTWVFYLHGAFLSQKLYLNQQGVDGLFVNLSIGFSTVLFILFFIALFNLLYLSIVSIVFLIVPIIYFYQKFKAQEQKILFSNISTGLINHAWLIFVVLFLLLPDTYNLFFPETSSDAMRYHLPYARFYAENNGLAVNEFLRYPVFSHNFNMAFSVGYLFLDNEQGEVLARMFSLFSFLLLVIGLYSLVLRSFNKTTAVIAIIILIKAKIFRSLMISGYIDIGLTLFLFTAIYFLYLWSEKKKEKWLYLSACVLGVVIGTKYLGLLWLFPLTIWVFFTNKSWKNTYQFFLIAIVVGSPWYIRNIFIAGNPLHPFLQDIFGYWLWSPEDIIRQKEDLLVRKGIDRTVLNFIKLPYLLETLYYFSKYHLGWLMTLGIPFLGFSIKMPKFYKYLAIFVFLNLVFWFFTSQIMRYLMPSLPFLAIFSSYPIGKILNPLFSYQPFHKKWLLALITTVVLSYGSYNIYTRYINLNLWKPLPQGKQDWEKANLIQNPYYPFIMELNNRQAQRVYNISDAMFENSFKGIVLGDWFGAANKRLIFLNCKSINEIVEVLDKYRTNYILIGKKKKWYNNVNKIIGHGQKDFVIIKETEDAILYLKRNKEGL